MNEQDASPADSTPTPGGTDRTGWSQPPAPQSPGPSGAFNDRPAAPPGAPLPPGAGSPLQPGPPMSVQAPIKDTTINLTVLLVGVAAVVLLIIILLLVIVAITGHH